jgi:hypothetical protein
MKRVCVTVIVLSWLASARGVPAAIAPEGAVAIVCLLSGKAAVKVENERRTLELFQRLRPGSVIEAGTGARIVLAFFTGDRYEFGEKSSATVGPKALERTSGPIRALPPVPGIIEIAPIAREERAGTRLAATRIRAAGPSIGGLYPSEGAAVASETAFVQFEPAEGYDTYRIDIEDESGNAVFSVETSSSTVRIPADALRPAKRYYWTVRTLDAARPTRRADALFSVLSNEDARRRAVFKAQVEGSGDQSLLALLAEVDRGLGLRREACQELQQALGEPVDSTVAPDAPIRFGCGGK